MTAPDMTDWLLDLRLTAADSGEVLSELAHRLRAEGLAADRVSLHVRQLHPRYRGRTLFWCPEEDKVQEIGRAHGIEQDPRYLNSPLAVIDRDRPAYRSRLAGGTDSLAEFPVLQELAQAGFTDYLMLRLPIGDGEPAIGLSIATRRAEGFHPDEVVWLERLVPTLATLLELFERRRTAEQLLETYLGRGSGRRVLDGTIKPGDGERIHAVIWSCDLHGFTALSEQIGLDCTIDILNRYFDAVGGAVDAHGGEILKFIGDGLLAVFPCRKAHGDACDAAHQALAAARDAEARIETLNGELAAEAGPHLDARFAVHVGEVMYGNVGAADRLDFTVIGPAVNLVARLQDLATRLEETVVVSGEIAQLAGWRFRSLGAHALKGHTSLREAFALDGPAPKPAAAPPAA